MVLAISAPRMMSIAARTSPRVGRRGLDELVARRAPRPRAAPPRGTRARPAAARPPRTPRSAPGAPPRPSGRIASTSSASSRSATVRAIGPITPNERIPGPAGSGACSANGRLSRPAFSPNSADEVARVADRAAEVGAEPERRHPAGDRRRLAAGGAAGRARRVVRVGGRAEQRVHRVPPARELRDVGLAEQDRARRAHRRHRRAVRVADVVGEQLRAVRRAHAGDRERVLARERHAVQRPASAPARVGRHGLLARLVQPRQHERVDLRIALGDPRRVRVEQLDRRDLALAHRASHPRRRPLDERGAHPSDTDVEAVGAQRLEVLVEARGAVQQRAAAGPRSPES